MGCRGLGPDALAQHDARNREPSPAAATRFCHWRWSHLATVIFRSWYEFLYAHWCCCFPFRHGRATALIGCQGKANWQSKQRPRGERRIWAFGGRLDLHGGKGGQKPKTVDALQQLPNGAVWCAGSRTPACRTFLAVPARVRTGVGFGGGENKRVLAVRAEPFGRFCTFARCFAAGCPPSARQSYIAHAGTKP
jgi:hypothetical protein